MKYEATFKNGLVLNRNTQNSYCAAWVVFKDEKVHAKGFSKSADHADKAATTRMNQATGRSWLKPRTAYERGWLREYAKKNGKGAYLAKVQEEEKRFRVEVVPAIEAK